jgi:hypothetical protein
MAKVPLVFVEWDDAWGDKEDEVTLESVASSHKPTKVLTVGWLVYEDEAGISIFNETYEGKYRGRTFIPRGMNPKVIPVKKSRKKKEAPQ